jgi:hypothetical protein
MLTTFKLGDVYYPGIPEIHGHITELEYLGNRGASCKIIGGTGLRWAI